MKRLFASLSVVSLLALGCSRAPTAPIALDRLNPSALLDCGSNTNNSNNNNNNPPATANGNANNNPPTTAKN